MSYGDNVSGWFILAEQAFILCSGIWWHSMGWRIIYKQFHEEMANGRPGVGLVM